MAGREASVESFPHQAVVGLRIAGTTSYLSCANDPRSHRDGMNFTVRGHCQAWEHFEVHRDTNGTISLQHILTRQFLSPTSCKSGVPWTARGHCQAWEKLTFTPSSHRGDGLVSGWHINTEIEGNKRFLAVQDDNIAVVSKEPQEWELVFAKVPLLPVADANLTDSFFWCIFNATEVHPGDPHRSLVLQILRALRTVGAFYISGHGLSADLLQTCCSSLRGEPFVDDASGVSGDSPYKKNHSLMGARGTKITSGLDAKALHIDSATHDQLVKSYFHGAEAISNGLLHAMGAAQAFGSDEEVGYRGNWRDKWRHIGLRVLSYHPGPIKNSDGKTIITTSRHTDATWLTLLANDDIDGLVIKSNTLGNLEVKPPLPGALLVNTGNVMAKASEGFFGSVCHWVHRTEATETQTRVSMPFFYDRADDRGDGPGYWNGGTGGC